MDLNNFSSLIKKSKNPIKKTLDYSDNTMRDAVQYEKNMNEFFMSIKAAIMADDKKLKKWTDAEKELHAEYEYRTRQGTGLVFFTS